MALTQRSRAVLYEALVAIVPEPEAVEEMLAQFPSRDDDEPASKEFIRAEGVLLRTDVQAELVALRTDLNTEISALRHELQSEIAVLRTELHTEISTLRHELQSEIGDLRTELHTEIATLRTDLLEVKGQLIRWVVACQLATITVIGSLLAFLG